MGKQFDMLGDVAPTNREQCNNNFRPCPCARCKYHLIFETDIRGKSDDEIVEKLLSMPESCVLDVTDTGEKTLHEVGKILGITRERVRQIEGASDRDYILKGISRLRKSPARMRYLEEIKSYG